MFISVEQVRKRFSRQGETGTGTAAVDGVSLSVERGRMLALVGPSGSGKTTLLRCIAGLETPDAGIIRIGEATVFSSSDGIHVPTQKRNIGLIFQNYALWPHLTIEQNVAYPLRRRRMAADEVRSRVAKYLELVGCAELSARYPHELSGGQQQRIALARALVYEPAVVLFDEPLSNLDPGLREHLRGQIREIQRAVGFTGVYVTHDREEAFYVADEIALLQTGRLLQTGSPAALFRAPCSAEVATFVGAVNIATGRIADGGPGGAQFEWPGIGALALPATLAAAARALTPATDVALMCRPEAVQLQSPAPGMVVATVIDRVLVGSSYEYALQVESGPRWRARAPFSGEHFEAGQQAGLALAVEGSFVFPAA